MRELVSGSWSPLCMPNSRKMQASPNDLATLSPLEERFVAAATVGRRFDCAPAGATGDDPDAIEDWDRRTIRAGVLTDVILGYERLGAPDGPGLRLRGARIAGRLDLSHADLGNRLLRFQVCRLDDGVVLTRCSAGAFTFTSCVIGALEADELDLTGSLRLSGSRITEAVMRDARIRGALICKRTRVHNPGKRALAADRLHASGAFLVEFESAGEVSFLHAQLQGDFTCNRSRLINPDGFALRAGVTASGMFFRGLEAEGELRLAGAQVRGLLSCDGARLSNPTGLALSGEGLDAGSISLADLHAEGEVQLLGTEIGRQLTCERAHLHNAGGVALRADRLRAADVVLGSVEADGEVRLNGALIGGRLWCTGAKLTNPGGVALGAYGVQVEADVSLSRVETEGAIVLVSARIGGRLSFDQARLSNPGGKVIDAEGCRVNGSLILRLLSPAAGEVDLEHAEVGPLVDDLASWPSPPAPTRLVGFSYRSIESQDRDPQQRIAWLRTCVPFSPDPYRQLESVYRRFGQESHARKVAIARENDLRRRGDLSRPMRVWNWLLGLSVGHGYRPGRALIPLVLLLLAGSVLFSLPAGRNALAPTDTDHRESAWTCTDRYPCFGPLIYSLDVLLPVVDLHQESAWLAVRNRPFGSWYLGLTWLLIGAGWVLTSAVIAGMASVWRKQ